MTPNWERRPRIGTWEDRGGWGLLNGSKAAYRLRPGDRVRDLPEEAQVAFSIIDGAEPLVRFENGAFWSVRWKRDRWGYGQPEKTKAEPGDWLILDAQGGIQIRRAADAGTMAFLAREFPDEKTDP